MFICEMIYTFSLIKRLNKRDVSYGSGESGLIETNIKTNYIASKNSSICITKDWCRISRALI